MSQTTNTPGGGKEGTNGKPFGKGYKGKGMCASCEESVVTPENVPWANAPPHLMCLYYGALCKHVCRNCLGIKSFRETPLKLIRTHDKT